MHIAPYAVLLFPLLLAACASYGDRQVTIATATPGGQEIVGANCAVFTHAGNWNVMTPAVLEIATSGDLRIVCHKEGYRTSELRLPPIARIGSGSSVGVGLGGGSGAVGVGLGFSVPIQTGSGQYPPRILVTMSPL